MADNIVQCLNELTAAVYALTEQIRLTQQACPTLEAPYVVYNHETNMVQWIDIDGNLTTTKPANKWTFPPSNPSVNITFTWGEGVKLLPEGSPPPTLTENDEKIGEGDYTTLPTATTAQDTTEWCAKANAAVEGAFEYIQDMQTCIYAAQIWVAVASALATFATVPTRYLTVKAGGTFILKEFQITGAMLKTFSDVLGIAATIFHPNLTLGLEDARQDLTCALYNNRSVKSIKRAWDSAVEKHYKWYSPTAALLRLYMNQSIAEAFVSADTVVSPTAPTPANPIDCATLCRPPLVRGAVEATLDYRTGSVDVWVVELGDLFPMASSYWLEGDSYWPRGVTPTYSEDDIPTDQTIKGFTSKGTHELDSYTPTVSPVVGIRNDHTDAITMFWHHIDNDWFWRFGTESITLEAGEEGVMNFGYWREGMSIYTPDGPFTISFTEVAE